jgi:hypothetical protein
MNAPQGVNVMWNTFMLLPGMLLAPVTLLFGPQTSLTVLMTAGFAGSATAMFAVLRRWQVSVPSAALGAAVYGRGAAWTEERGMSDEGRQRLRAPRKRAGDTVRSQR